MRKRIYIETSVVSYFTARPSHDIMIADHQGATRELWPELLEKYETKLADKPIGRPFEEVYHVDTVRPTQEWQGLYEEVKNELIGIGVPLP